MAEIFCMANDDVFGFDEASSPVFAAFTDSKSDIIVERVKISDGGRLVIPAAMRAAMKVEVGDTVLLKLDNGSLRVDTITSAVQRVHAIAKKYDNGAGNLVDQFIVEKHEEQRRGDERLAKLNKQGSRGGRKRA
jgi:bifunctional DNA-binding transcriptional regulator/antitoxin component of YhaV-PrlF toxin-antitoxin module